MSNKSHALPDSLPACSAFLAGKHPMSVCHTEDPIHHITHTWPSCFKLYCILCRQAIAQAKLGTQVACTVGQCRGFLTTASLEQNRTFWKKMEKYTIKPMGIKKTGGRDHSGKEYRSLKCG